NDRIVREGNQKHRRRQQQQPGVNGIPPRVGSPHVWFGQRCDCVLCHLREERTAKPAVPLPQLSLFVSLQHAISLRLSPRKRLLWLLRARNRCLYRVIDELIDATVFMNRKLGYRMVELIAGYGGGGEVLGVFLHFRGLIGCGRNRDIARLYTPL